MLWLADDIRAAGCCREAVLLPDHVQHSRKDGRSTSSESRWTESTVTEDTRPDSDRF